MASLRNNPAFQADYKQLKKVSLNPAKNFAANALEHCEMGSVSGITSLGLWIFGFLQSVICWCYAIHGCLVDCPDVVWWALPTLQGGPFRAVLFSKGSRLCRDQLGRRGRLPYV